MFHNMYFENHTVYEIMWENIVERERPLMTMAHAYCMQDK